MMDLPLKNDFYIGFAKRVFKIQVRMFSHSDLLGALLMEELMTTIAPRIRYRGITFVPREELERG